MGHSSAVGPGLREPRALRVHWAARDPIALYVRRLQAEGIVEPGDVERFKHEAEAIVEAEARAIIEAPWPEPSQAGVGVFANEPARKRVEVLDPADPINRGARRDAEQDSSASSAVSAVRRGQVELSPPFDPKGRTLLEGVMLGVGDALRADPRVFVYGEDVGGNYGNAFLLLKPLVKEFGDRLINSPLGESARAGRLCRRRDRRAAADRRDAVQRLRRHRLQSAGQQRGQNAIPVGARLRRPMVVRMPWGGLRHAGPYHSQNTEAWFYHTAGLKIVAPSTPHDARALMASAVADPDPVLYYEHIALYRDPRIKQMLSDAPPEPDPAGTRRRCAAPATTWPSSRMAPSSIRACGSRQRWRTTASRRACWISASLTPLDRDAVLAVARRCHKGADHPRGRREPAALAKALPRSFRKKPSKRSTRPIRIVGALDTPVPYSPSLEGFYLPSDAYIERAARLLIAY